MSAVALDEVEGLDAERETVCSDCSLVYWRALGACPTCAAERSAPTSSERLVLA